MKIDKDIEAAHRQYLAAQLEKKRQEIDPGVIAYPKGCSSCAEKARRRREEQQRKLRAEEPA